MSSENQSRPDGAPGGNYGGQEGSSASENHSSEAFRLLRAIHSERLIGVIEVRLFEDKKGGKIVDRCWYPSIEALDQDLPRLLALAETRTAAVCYGVLARRESGQGKAEHALAGRVVWCDIDFKVIAGGEADARQRIASFPLPPSIVVRSGHGLHLYWLLREDAEPQELSALSKAIAAFLGGDHTFDAARLLRLPGTYNRKDPANAILVTIESLDADRACNASELRDALELVGSDPPGAESSSDDDPGDEGPPPPKMPERVRGLIQQHKRLALLFNGRGKPGVGSDGKELDCSSSGYDYSFLAELVKHGVKDEAELAAALANRPDGAAHAKKPSYIKRTVASVLAAAKKAEEAVEEFQVDFEVQHFKIFDSNPARYEIKIKDVAFPLSSPDLRSPGRFAVAYMDALHRVPSVPKAQEVWVPIVNGWLAKAEVVKMPPDASREPRLREAVQRVIKEFPVGDAAEDLDHGKACQLPSGARAFKAEAILRRLRDEWSDLEQSDITRVLKTLGYSSHTATIGGKSVRVWSHDSAPA